MFKIISGLVVGLAMTACSSTGIKSAGSFLPRMRSQVGHSHNTKYYSHARIQSFEDQQLTRDRQEIVEFEVANRTTQVSEDGKSFSTLTKTIKKDGTTSLHELAFPELNEEILFTVAEDAKILKAGDKSPDSLFFVPFLPLPQKPVEIGDTWPLQHTWISRPSLIPLKLDMVAILKDAYPCRSGDTCLDIEISGKVIVGANPSQADTKFDGNLWGRMVFSMNAADVLWSETKSSEEMRIGKERMSVASCMVSQMQSLRGKAVGPNKKSPLICDPSISPVSNVPKF